MKGRGRGVGCGRVWRHPMQSRGMEENLNLEDSVKTTFCLLTSTSPKTKRHQKVRPQAKILWLGVRRSKFSLQPAEQSHNPQKPYSLFTIKCPPYQDLPRSSVQQKGSFCESSCSHPYALSSYGNGIVHTILFYCSFL